MSRITIRVEEKKGKPFEVWSKPGDILLAHAEFMYSSRQVHLEAWIPSVDLATSTVEPVKSPQWTADMMNQDHARAVGKHQRPARVSGDQQRMTWGPCP